MKHSTLGASGAERWMNCPGSITLFKLTGMTRETEEPSYRTDGQCAHGGALWCLENGADAWEAMDMVFDKIAFTAPMALGVQVYLDAVRADITENSICYFEQQISDPAVHPDFFGTTDCGVVEGEWLIVSDYKNGAGIPVDVDGNPQVMYYAYGLLRKIQDPRVKFVRLRIVQPNAHHPGGLVREWDTTADDLCKWAEGELVPAMQRTETDTTLDVGSHCRFCPAKLVCPALSGLFAAVSGRDATIVKELTDAELGRQYVLMEPTRMYIKAVNDETFRRLLAGKDVEGAKLVEKKADRVFKDGAGERFMAELGDKAYGPPSLLSPAQMEKLGGVAKALVKEWAYSPKTGYTVELTTSKRMGVVVKTVAETFSGYVEAMENEDAIVS